MRQEMEPRPQRQRVLEWVQTLVAPLNVQNIKTPQDGITTKGPWGQDIHIRAFDQRDLPVLEMNELKQIVAVPSQGKGIHVREHFTDDSYREFTLSGNETNRHQVAQVHIPVGRGNYATMEFSLIADDIAELPDTEIEIGLKPTAVRDSLLASVSYANDSGALRNVTCVVEANEGLDDHTHDLVDEISSGRTTPEANFSMLIDYIRNPLYVESVRRYSAGQVMSLLEIQEGVQEKLANKGRELSDETVDFVIAELAPMAVASMVNNIPLDDRGTMEGLLNSIDFTTVVAKELLLMEGNSDTGFLQEFVRNPNQIDSHLLTRAANNAISSALVQIILATAADTPSEYVSFNIYQNNQGAYHMRQTTSQEELWGDEDDSSVVVEQEKPVNDGAQLSILGRTYTVEEVHDEQDSTKVVAFRLMLPSKDPLRRQVQEERQSLFIPLQAPVDTLAQIALDPMGNVAGLSEALGIQVL